MEANRRKGYPTRLMRYCCQLLKRRVAMADVYGCKMGRKQQEKSYKRYYETFATEKRKVILTNDNEDTRRITKLLQAQQICL